MTSFTTVDTPLSRVLLLGDERGLTGLYFEHQPRGPASDPGWRRGLLGREITRIPCPIIR